MRSAPSPKSQRRWSVRIGSLALLLSVVMLFGIACRVSRRNAKRFPHYSHHLLACSRCHKANAAGQMSLGIPTKPCLYCHKEREEFRPVWLVKLAKRGPVPPTDRHLIFSHELHLKKLEKDHRLKTVQQRCKHCHGAVTQIQGGRNVPSMDRCLSCHNHKKDYDQMNCKRCHKNLGRYPLKPLSDYRHTANFVRTHKKYARGRLDLCVNCHDQPFCARCHDPTQRIRASLRFPANLTSGFIHRGDFQSRHANIARLRPTLCKRCHGQSRCVSCHQQRKVVLTAKKRVGMSPHPPGYVRRGGKAFHGYEARRNPARCQSCHDQGRKSNCIKCHRVGGIGGNPHPLGWRGKVINTRLNPKKNPMCLYCHR